MRTAIEIGGAIVVGLSLCWLALIVVLWRLGPRDRMAGEALRALPDIIRLIHRLARDRTLPRSVRVRLWMLLAYLASPIDIVPDFIPVVGYADDVVIVALTLRSITRVAGVDALDRHWPGTPEGLAALKRLVGL